MQSVNFTVSLTTLVYEIFGVIEILSCKGNTQNVQGNQFVLYIGTLLSFFLSEVVYDPFEPSKFSRQSIIVGSVAGCIISIVSITSPNWANGLLQVTKILICGCYFVLTIAFFVKVLNFFNYRVNTTVSDDNIQELHITCRDRHLFLK